MSCERRYINQRLFYRTFKPMNCPEAAALEVETKVRSRYFLECEQNKIRHERSISDPVKDYLMVRARVSQIIPDLRQPNGDMKQALSDLLGLIEGPYKQMGDEITAYGNILQEACDDAGRRADAATEAYNAHIRACGCAHACFRQ